MRAGIVLLLVLAGCASPAETNEVDPLFDPEPPEPQPPATHYFYGNITAGMLPCLPACPTFAFDTNHTGLMQVRLTWTLDANDLDLTVYHNDRFWASSGNASPGTSESVSGEMEPGRVEVQVQPWLSGPDSYVVEVSYLFTR